MTEGVERSTQVASGDELRLGDPGVPPEVALLVDAALERHARDPVILDLRGLSDATDFFFIVSGDSDVHTRSIAENLVRSLDEHGFDPVGIEGRSSGRWILLDYVDVVVHVFLPRVREFYRLEQLWGDAPRTTVEA
jgi:ribosome-associated protein